MSPHFQATLVAVLLISTEEPFESISPKVYHRQSCTAYCVDWIHHLQAYLSEFFYHIYLFQHHTEAIVI